MKLNKRYQLILIFFGIMFSICAITGVKSLAQSLEGYVVEGESIDSIEIGKSTADDVIAVYGADYKLINHNQYSYEMIYKNLGLAFYYCQADPNKEIFVVEIEPPFKAMTRSGIVLGESTVADVFRIYGEVGENSSGFEYDGIYFYAEEDNDDEDREDARIQPSIVENTEVVNDKSELTDGFVIDDEEISNERVGELNQSNNLDENESEVQEVQADKTIEESEADKARKAQIIKRIELIEKGGLRQCDSEFPKN